MKIIERKSGLEVNEDKSRGVGRRKTLIEEGSVRSNRVCRVVVSAGGQLNRGQVVCVYVCGVSVEVLLDRGDGSEGVGYS